MRKRPSSRQITRIRHAFAPPRAMAKSHQWYFVKIAPTLAMQVYTIHYEYQCVVLPVVDTR